MVAIDESTAAGVSFSLTEEQKELRRLARTFAEREIRPNEAKHDAEIWLLVVRNALLVAVACLLLAEQVRRVATVPTGMRTAAARG